MIGKQIAHYKVEALLGAGGMGEVYQARDTKLDRSVAVKMLPEIFARDLERVARFEREAKVLASLNHANIAALYGMEESGGQRFIVMELVAGDTLAERIARGPIPTEEALEIAHQIAEALEAAHEKNVIHRDLKPANVKITPEGKVKVLDFGLAKALEAAPAQMASNSPTLLSAAATNAGVLLGTVGYMSPEQAKGHAADQRSDIFSFGCVLYEMVTGRQTFQAETVAETLAAVLMREPDLKVMAANLHPKLEELIRRCLAKNRKERWHAIADVRVELEAIMRDPDGTKFLAARGVERRPLWKSAIPVVAAIVLTFAITAIGLWNIRPSPQPAGLARFPFVLPEGQILSNRSGHLVAISPDGANFVYATNQQLYLRSMADMDSRPIQGTALNPDTPFFSPDGRWLAFYAGSERKLKKIAITGGASVTICDADQVFGASWNSDGNIFFGQGTKGIFRVSSNGGKPEAVVSVKPGEYALGPQVLPGGDALLFTVSLGASPNAWDRARIVIQNLKSGERKVVIEGGSDARYVPTGHIVYALATTVLAVPFDLKKLQVTGGPVPIIEGARRFYGTTASGVAEFSFSSNGSVVYVPSGSFSPTTFTAERTIALVDRAGIRRPLNIPPGPYDQLRISPNGKQLALHSDDGKESIVWIYDLADSAPLRRLTFEGRNTRPLWTKDGERIVFQSLRENGGGLFWQRADGSGPAEQLTMFVQGSMQGSNGGQPEAWSADGKTLIFMSFRAPVFSLWTLSLGADQKPKPLIEEAGNSSMSPDGHWLAYTSTSGQNEVYVQPFPPTGARYQISTSGGRNPLWSPDGKQLFYQQTPGLTRIVSVDIKTQPSFVFGKTTPLPIEGILEIGPRGYDITPDGKYFVVKLPKAQPDTGKAPAEQINITLNWFEELKQRVPVK